MPRAFFINTALIALAMALAFPPFGLWPLMFVSLFFLGRGLLSKETVNDLRSGFLYLASYSFFVNIFGFYWLAYLLNEFANLPWIAAAPLALLIFLLLSIGSGLAGSLWFLLRKKTEQSRKTWLPYAALFVFLFLWDSLDYRFFPWSPIMSLGGNRYLLASVGLLGNWGWRLVVFGLVACALFVDHQFGRRNLLKAFLPVSAIVLLALGGLGAFQISRLEQKYSQRQPVFLLQGNVGNYEKKLSKLGAWPTVENVLKIHGKLLDEVYSRISHERFNPKAPEPWIFWPETAFPYYPRLPSPPAEWLQAEIYRLGGLQLVGSYEKDLVEFGGRKIPLDFNTVQLFHARDGYLGHYRKHIRIAFGEYIPFDDIFPKAYEYLPMVNHFGRGYQLDALPHPDPQGPVFVPVVCYEILHEFFVKKFLTKVEAEFPGRDLILVNPTNDSWYGPTSEPSQHSLLARWQTALVARPMLRPTNTGYSQVVAPWGEVLAEGLRDESLVVRGELPVSRQIWRGQNP